MEQRNGLCGELGVFRIVKFFGFCLHYIVKTVDFIVECVRWLTITYIYIHYICTIVRIVKVHSSIWMLMKASHYAAGILELLLGAGITQPINGSHSLERNKIRILLSTCSHGLVRSNALWRKVVYCWVSTYFIVECGSMRNQAVRKCERISTMHEKRNQESWGWTTPLPNNRRTTNQLKVVDKENIIYSIKWHEGNAYYFLPPPKALLFYDE